MDGNRDEVMDLAPDILQIAVLIPGPLTRDDEPSFTVQPLGDEVV
jgi:hypothetical protein